MNYSTDSISVSNQTKWEQSQGPKLLYIPLSGSPVFPFSCNAFYFKHKKYFELMTNLFQHSLIMWTWGTMRGVGRGYCERTDQVRGEHEGGKGG